MLVQAMTLQHLLNPSGRRQFAGEKLLFSAPPNSLVRVVDRARRTEKHLCRMWDGAVHTFELYRVVASRSGQFGVLIMRELVTLPLMSTTTPYFGLWTQTWSKVVKGVPWSVSGCFNIHLPSS